MTSVYIYALCEPYSHIIRYIGRSNDPSRRLCQHLSPTELRLNTAKTRWLRGLIAKGGTPTLLVLDVVDAAVAQYVERHTISHYRLQGCALTNSTSGGEGVWAGKRSDLMRQTLSDAAKRRGVNPATLARFIEAGSTRTQTIQEREKRRIIMTGHKMSPESIAKTAAAKRGKKRAPETVEKMRAAATGRKPSDEARAKRAACMREAWARRKADPDAYAKWATAVGNARRGKKATSETRAKLSAAHIGHTHTPEARQKIGAASRERGSAQIALRARWAKDCRDGADLPADTDLCRT